MTDSLHILAFMMGPFEWGVVLVVAVLIFGRRLPEIAKGVGKSLTEFKKGVKEAQTEVTSAANDIDESTEPKKQEDIKEEKIDHIE
jgi:sec-independent protein translocase protein TatA